MPKKTWTLTDVERDVYVSSLHVGPGDVRSSSPAESLPPFAIRKRTLRGGVRDGVDVVEIDNGALRITVVPTRGMGIHHVACKSAAGEGESLRLGWQSPVHGPVHPRFVPQDEASGIGWLSGFDEFLVRCGLEYCGSPEWNDAGKLIHPLHGRIANLPAHFVEVSVDPATRELEIVGIVDEARLFSNKLRLKSTLRTTLDDTSFSVTDEITNLSSAPGELELLYHINQGAPLAVPGARFSAAVQTLVPKDAVAARDVPTWQNYPPRAHAPEIVHFFELVAGDDGWTKTMLAAPDGGQGLSVAFNRRQFPLFTLWKNPLPAADGYVTGLEPCINLPHTKGFEKSQGRVATLEPGETRRFDMRLEALTTPEAVARTQAEIDVLQKRAVPTIHKEPQRGWSPI
ncbi:MAG: aldose 1-epimerase family protein [Pirellulales bacterium]